MEGRANTLTDRVARTILDVANDSTSDGTSTFAQKMTRLIGECRDTWNQSERMRDILGVIKCLRGCMRDMTSKYINIAMPINDGIIVLTAAVEAINEIRSAATKSIQGGTAADKTNEEAPNPKKKRLILVARFWTRHPRGWKDGLIKTA